MDREKPFLYIDTNFAPDEALLAFMAFRSYDFELLGMSTSDGEMHPQVAAENIVGLSASHDLFMSVAAGEASNDYYNDKAIFTTSKDYVEEIPAFENIIDKAVWIFGMVTFLPLLYMVLYKDRHNPETKEGKMPLVCISASNGGLLLTGYFNLFENYSLAFVIFMIVLGQAVYFLAVSKLPNLLKLRFYPSYSSFTFPFVINVTALKLTIEYLGGLGVNTRVLNLLLIGETGLAVILVSYVFFSYIKYLATE